MKTCVLIPAYNEGKTIGPIVHALRKRHFPVVVVDDGSKDDTQKIAQREGAVVLRNDPNHGKGFSLQRGFEYILQHGYEGVIMMDGDGQHDVEDVDKFLDVIAREPVSIVNGNRMALAKGMPLIRYLTNRIMSWMISSVCGQRIADTQCGYRYVASQILKQIHLESGDFEIETEILMKAAKKGYKIYSVPIRTIYSGQVSQIHPFKDTIRFIRYFSKEIFQKK